MKNKIVSDGDFYFNITVINNKIKKCSCNEKSVYVSCSHLKKIYGKKSEKERIQSLKKSKKAQILNDIDLKNIKNLKNGESYEFESSSLIGQYYEITKKMYGSFECTCPSYVFSKGALKTCKHVKFVLK